MRANITLSCYCEIVYAEEKIIWSMGNLGGRKGGDVMKNKEKRHRKGKGKNQPGHVLPIARSSAWAHTHLGRSMKYECLCPTSRDSDIIGLGAA